MFKFSMKSDIFKIFVAGFLAMGVTFTAFTASAEPFTGLKPASPQPNAAELKPGLAVQYYGAKFNNLEELDDWMKYDDGKPGIPLPMLNYHVGTGDVLTTKSNDFVGADIKGFIKMDKPGRYTFLVHSNDGVYLAIGDKLIYEFPTVHADTFSDELVLEISEPGWYPIHIKYFEKKNTSTLELYWEAPSGGDMDFVPAEAFAHIGK
ncbi:PA14 domain-containing protein [Sneathiella marina]|uniref:PA14 domain-containing protein n=1 Tax=Sneathiella marina TaxID=2950108 RepID=A0ABY4VXN7_9PROT|nr:PA14 domain-containing protein [Sneathiella marina]USG59691.1 PA14 domain-containing protein [Sneathiella marina]